jgi:hypothetical protein
MHRTNLLGLANRFGRSLAQRDAPTEPTNGPTGTPEGDGGKPADTDPAAGKPTIQGEFDKDRYERTLASARQGEKAAKEAKAAADERLAAVLKAAGLTADGKTDPAEALKAAAAERDAAVKAARDTAVELAVYRIAGKAGADPDAVLDSRGFLAAVKDLDPNATDFRDKVTDAVKAAVKNNARLAAAPAPAGQGPAKQGVDHTGSGGKKTRSGSLNAAVAKRLGG